MEICQQLRTLEEHASKKSYTQLTKALQSLNIEDIFTNENLLSLIGSNGILTRMFEYKEFSFNCFIYVLRTLQRITFKSADYAERFQLPIQCVSTIQQVIISTLKGQIEYINSFKKEEFCEVILHCLQILHNLVICSPKNILSNAILNLAQSFIFFGVRKYELIDLELIDLAENATSKLELTNYEKVEAENNQTSYYMNKNRKRRLKSKKNSKFNSPIDLKKQTSISFTNESAFRMPYIPTPPDSGSLSLKPDWLLKNAQKSLKFKEIDDRMVAKNSSTARNSTPNSFNEQTLKSDIYKESTNEKSDEIYDYDKKLLSENQETTETENHNDEESAKLANGAENLVTESLLNLPLNIQDRKYCVSTALLNCKFLPTNNFNLNSLQISSESKNSCAITEKMQESKKFFDINIDMKKSFLYDSSLNVVTGLMKNLESDRKSMTKQPILKKEADNNYAVNVNIDKNIHKEKVNLNKIELENFSENDKSELHDKNVTFKNNNTFEVFKHPSAQNTTIKQSSVRIAALKTVKVVLVNYWSNKFGFWAQLMSQSNSLTNVVLYDSDAVVRLTALQLIELLLVDSEKFFILAIDTEKSNTSFISLGKRLFDSILELHRCICLSLIQEKTPKVLVQVMKCAELLLGNVNYTKFKPGLLTKIITHIKYFLNSKDSFLKANALSLMVTFLSIKPNLEINSILVKNKTIAPQRLVEGYKLNSNWEDFDSDSCESTTQDSDHSLSSSESEVEDCKLEPFENGILEPKLKESVVFKSKYILEHSEFKKESLVCWMIKKCTDSLMGNFKKLCDSFQNTSLKEAASIHKFRDPVKNLQEIPHANNTLNLSSNQITIQAFKVLRVLVLNHFNLIQENMCIIQDVLIVYCKLYLNVAGNFERAKNSTDGQRNLDSSSYKTDIDVDEVVIEKQIFMLLEAYLSSVNKMVSKNERNNAAEKMADIFYSEKFSGENDEPVDSDVVMNTWLWAMEHPLNFLFSLAGIRMNLSDIDKEVIVDTNAENKSHVVSPKFITLAAKSLSFLNEYVLSKIGENLLTAILKVILWLIENENSEIIFCGTLVVSDLCGLPTFYLHPLGSRIVKKALYKCPKELLKFEIESFYQDFESCELENKKVGSYNYKRLEYNCTIENDSADFFHSNFSNSLINKKCIDLNNHNNTSELNGKSPKVLGYPLDVSDNISENVDNSSENVFVANKQRFDILLFIAKILSAAKFYQNNLENLKKLTTKNCKNEREIRNKKKSKSRNKKKSNSSKSETDLEVQISNDFHKNCKIIKQLQNGELDNELEKETFSPANRHHHLSDYSENENQNFSENSFKNKHQNSFKSKSQNCSCKTSQNFSKETLQNCDNFDSILDLPTINNILDLPTINNILDLPTINNILDVCLKSSKVINKKVRCNIMKCIGLIICNTPIEYFNFSQRSTENLTNCQNENFTDSKNQNLTNCQSKKLTNSQINLKESDKILQNKLSQCVDILIEGTQDSKIGLQFFSCSSLSKIGIYLQDYLNELPWKSRVFSSLSKLLQTSQRYTCKKHAVIVLYGLKNRTCYGAEFIMFWKNLLILIENTQSVDHFSNAEQHGLRNDFLHTLCLCVCNFIQIMTLEDLPKIAQISRPFENVLKILISKTLKEVRSHEAESILKADEKLSDWLDFDVLTIQQSDSLVFLKRLFKPS